MSAMFRKYQPSGGGGDGFAGNEVFAPAGPDGPKYRLPARWSVRIESLSGHPLAVKLAIGFADQLEMMELTTPVQFDFIASGYTALISAGNPDDRIEVEVWSDLYGEFRLNGGFTGRSRGKLTFDPAGPRFSSAGTGFGG
jgi:hypothetical protein